MTKGRQDRGDENPAPLDLGETLEFLRLIWAIDHGLQLASKRTEARSVSPAFSGLSSGFWGASRACPRASSRDCFISIRVRCPACWPGSRTATCSIGDPTHETHGGPSWR